MQLTSWDWLLLVVGLFSVGFGFWRGFIRTVFGLLGWLIALLATPLLVPMVLPIFNMQDAWWVAIPIFIVLMIVVRMLGSLVSAGLSKAGLGGLDRILGALLGIARALLIVAVVALVAKQFGWQRQEAWQLAACKPVLEIMVDWLEPFLPDRLSGIKRT